MNKLIILLTLIFVPFLCFTQDQQFRVRCETEDCGCVIALSGVKLRTSPSITGKVIAVIPFAEKVTRVRRRTQMTEDINTLEYSQDSIPGWWEQVKWKNKTGYVFNAFLADEIPKLDKDFYLVMEDQAWCWSDLYGDPDYFYYGLFLNNDSSQTVLRRIKPTFYGNGEEVVMHAVEKESTLFLFASKYAFAEEGVIQKNEIPFRGVQQFDMMPGQFISALKPEQESIESKFWRLHYITKVANGQTSTMLQLEDLRSSKKQIISEKEWPYTSTKLLWCGDLDRDGIQDFLLMGTGDDAGAACLFLSRNPGKGRLMRLAGTYGWGDCC